MSKETINNAPNEKLNWQEWWIVENIRSDIAENLDNRETNEEAKVDSTFLCDAKFEYDEKLADNADIILIYRDNFAYADIRETNFGWVFKNINIYNIVFNHSLQWVSNSDDLKNFIEKYENHCLIMTDYTISSRAGVDTKTMLVDLSKMNDTNDENYEKMNKQVNLFLSQIEQLKNLCEEKEIKKIYLVCHAGNPDHGCFNSYILHHGSLCESPSWDIYFQTPNILCVEEDISNIIRFWSNRFGDINIIPVNFWRDTLWNEKWEVKDFDNALIIADAHAELYKSGKYKCPVVETYWAEFFSNGDRNTFSKFLWEWDQMTRVDRYWSESLGRMATETTLPNRILDEYKLYKEKKQEN